MRDRDGIPFADAQETPHLIEAIDNLKILDPAVGSGAFPMGCLQRLVELLAVLDPDNERWQQQQQRRARLPELKTIAVDQQTAGKIVDDKARKKAQQELDQRAAEVKQTFAHHAGYARKLFLIENNIFGVDIQPSAIQIAKLRFFITLTIEQKIDNTHKNRGIQPLPNLETKLIVANSLVGVRSRDGSPIDSERGTDELQKKLNDTRQRHFAAKTRATKMKCRKEDKRIREEIATVLTDKSAIDPDAKKIANWDPYNQNATADWFDMEYMFGVEKGFDIVIGNPPYVKTEHLDIGTRKKLKLAYQWQGDLYDHFIFKGHELNKHGALLCLITNDSFIQLSSKKRIREMFLCNQLLKLVNAPAQTFQKQSIYTAILLLHKEKPNENHYYHSGKITAPDFGLGPMTKILYNDIRTMPNIKFLTEKNFISRLITTLPTLSKSLLILDTGIHSGNARRKIFFAEHESGRHRLLQGRQINSYVLQWNSDKAKYRWCDIAYQSKPIKGIGRGGKPSTRNEYWHFCGDVKNHHQPVRLLMRQTEDDLVVAYHNEKQHGRFYTDNTLFTIFAKTNQVDLKFALALLNSRLMNAAYHYISQEQGKAQAQVKTRTVEILPFIVPDALQQQAFIKLADKILAAKTQNKNADTLDIEAEIDRLTYQLYDLTDNEIAAINAGG